MYTTRINQALCLFAVMIAVISADPCASAAAPGSSRVQSNPAGFSRNISNSAPRITSTVDVEDIAGRTITVSGTSLPFAAIQVEIDHTNMAAAENEIYCSAVATKVTADSEGKWAARDLPLRFNSEFSSSCTHFDITAVSIGFNGQKSVASSISIRGCNLCAHRTGR